MSTLSSAERGELVRVVGAAFAAWGDVVQVEEAVVAAAGDDAALVVPARDLAAGAGTGPHFEYPALNARLRSPSVGWP